MHAAKPDRAGCVTLFPRRPALALLHVPQLVGCVPRGAPFVDHGPAKRKVIALTFDDGPWYDTPEFLNILERYDVHATFSEAAAIRQATHGFQPCLFRAPYGAVSPALISEARSMGFTTIQWDIDPRDWVRRGVNAIYDNVVANAHPGAIVIQHDGGGDRAETLAALPREIQTLRSRGYRFVTITQLLGMRLLCR